MYIQILGDVGSGKTLLMVIFAMMSNRTIASNFTLRMSDKNIVKLTPQIIFADQKDYLVLADEIYTLADARRSMSGENTVFSYLLYQSRKKSVDVMGTAQQMRSIDVRFRDFLDVRIHAEAVTDSNFDTIGFKYTSYAKDGTITDFGVDIETAKKYFDLYDTNEIVRPPDNRNPFDKVRARKLIPMIRKQIPVGKPITKALVEFICVDNDITEYKVIRYIYTAIKSGMVKGSKKKK